MHMSTITALRRGGSAVAAVLACAALAAPAAHASPASDASSWLAGQLTGGDHYVTVFGGTGYDDAGLTADGLLAFAANGATTPAGATAGWLTSGAYPDGYVGDGSTESYAGALGKLSAALEAQGLDPNDTSDTNGRTLVSDLQARQVASGPDAGRFSDLSAFGDYSSMFGQAWGILALEKCAAGACASPPSGTSTTVANAAAFVRGQQCPDGGFPSELDAATCTSDVDSTGMAVQALLAVGGTANDTAASDGVAFISGAQSGGGDYWESAACGGVPSVNSTALAVMALSAAGQPVGPYVTWLDGTQNGGPDFGLPACGATGAGDVRATTQGIYGLTGSPVRSYKAQLGL
jgi:hypothetical protein